MLTSLIPVILLTVAVWSAPQRCQPAPDCQAPAVSHDKPDSPMTARERWAWIVMGESGGGWDEGSLLVAWTLRAWEVYRGMPAGQAGRSWGWHGWREPNGQAWAAVRAAWDRPMTDSPFAFMRAGSFCFALGSAHDSRYWRALGWYDVPDFSISFPLDPRYQMNCYWHKGHTASVGP